ncbi:MAG: DUF2905 domain-containing protein [Nitrospinota bacterium]
MPFGGTGKILMILGAALFAAGGLLSLFGRIPWLGQLPGDIYIQRKGFHFYFPLGTSLLLSAVLSFLLYLFFRR